MKVEATKIEQISYKDVYMLMLLHLNEDFDDDLLSDCICLLEREKWLCFLNINS